LRTITREGLADGVLADLRFDTDGQMKSDFFLNRTEFANAAILLVGDNFGCGSSRELYWPIAIAFSSFSFAFLVGTFTSLLQYV